jgi:hypothetical protein
MAKSDQQRPHGELSKMCDAEIFAAIRYLDPDRDTEKLDSAWLIAAYLLGILFLLVAYRYFEHWLFSR